MFTAFPLEMAAQSRSVSGRVVDENGEGVISAAVTNKSTRETVITDNTGFFTIVASAGEVLKVEMLGYLDGERLDELIEGDKGYCDACFSGNYPVEPPQEDIRGEYEQ